MFGKIIFVIIVRNGKGIMSFDDCCHALCSFMQLFLAFNRGCLPSVDTIICNDRPRKFFPLHGYRMGYV